jgi:glycosyltransferase involved in cell wall biosynthesis
LRVLELIDTATLGGAEKHTRLFAEALAQAGHEVWLTHPSGPYAQHYKKASYDGVHVTELPEIRTSFLTAVRKLVHLCHTQQIEVIHSHQHRADLLAVLVGRACNIAVTTTIHNQLGKDVPWTRDPIKRFFYYLLARYSLSRMKLILATSSQVSTYIQRFFHLPADKLTVILNAIDTRELDRARSRDEMRRELGLDQDDYVIACTATLEERKGQRHLIEAIARLPGDLRPVVLFMGIGKMRTELRARAVRQGVSSNTRFLGYREDAIDIVNCCDAYVQPSLVDPLPRALLEAMYLGVPCIASAVDGIPDVITHCKTGLLTQPADPSSLAIALDQLMRERSLGKELSSAARAFVSRHCTMGRMVDAYMSTLAEK